MSQPYPSTRPLESTMAAYHAETPSHKTRRHLESTIAAYHAETPSHRTRRPPEGTIAAYHARTPPHGEHGPQPKPDGRLPRERHLPKGKPPSTHLMVEYQRLPTPKGPLGKFLPFTLDPRIAKKGILGQKAHPR